MFFVKDRFSEMPLIIQTVLRSLSVALLVVFFVISLLFLFSDVPNVPYIGVTLFLLSFYIFTRFFFARRSLRKLKVKEREDANVVDYIPSKLLSDLRILRSREREFEEDFSLGFMLYAIEFPEVKKAFERLDVSFEEFGDKVYEFVGSKEIGEEEKNTSFFEDILVSAAKEAIMFGEKEITIFDVLSALIESGGKDARNIFKMFGVTKEELRAAEVFERVNKDIFSGELKYFTRRFSSGKQSVFRPIKIPLLNDLATDITDLAIKGEVGFMIGHDEEYKILKDKLSDNKNTGVILKGKAGVGKEAIVYHLAFMIFYGEASKVLKSRRVYKMNIEKFFSGEEREIAKRIDNVLKKAREYKKIIFYIPNISNLLDIKNGKVYSAMIEGLITEAEAGVILADSPEGVTKIKRVGWFKKFFEIDVDEISEEEAFMYLAYISSIKEKKNELKITVSALKRAIILARENKKIIPSGAIDFLNAGIELVKARGGDQVSFADVAEAEKIKKGIVVKKN